MADTFRARLDVKWNLLAAFVLVQLIFANAAVAQTRGFPGATPPLAVESLLLNWQAIQDQLRASVGTKRRPEFEFRLLARQATGGKSDEKFTANKLPHRIVLVMGGLQGSVLGAEQFGAAVYQTLHAPMDTRMAVFGYPNDGSICESADVLHEMLTELHKESPETKVSIIAHSMGSLVARHAIEPAAPQAGCRLACVDQLIMICPPNHGSVLAQYADALEFPDALTKMQSGSLSFTQVVESLINDGLGEACEELVPNSPFLRELNGRRRAEGVRYSIICGTGGPITPLVRLASAIAFKETRERTRINQLPNAKDVLNRADELLLSDEFAQGLGDGAVSVRSATLPEVREFYTVPINHCEWAQTDSPTVRQLIQRTADLLCPKVP